MSVIKFYFARFNLHVNIRSVFYLALVAVIGCGERSTSASAGAVVAKQITQQQKKIEALDRQLAELNAQMASLQPALEMVKKSVQKWHETPLPVSYKKMRFEITEEMFVPFISGEAVVEVSGDAPDNVYLDTGYQVSFPGETRAADITVQGSNLVRLSNGRGLLRFKTQLPKHNLSLDDAEIKLKPQAWLPGFSTALHVEVNTGLSSDMSHITPATTY